MKTSFAFSLLLIFCTLQVFAQNPLIGTWEYQSDTVKSLKIITPTYWMMITENPQATPNHFIRAHGGTYKITNNKYIENIEFASWEDFRNTKAEFTYKTDGNVFRQNGTLKLPSGEEFAIDEKWQKVKASAQRKANDPAIGTWNKISAEHIDANGKKSAPQEKEVIIITPTHWIFLAEDMKTKKFASAAAGTYTKKGDKIYPQTDYASWDHRQPDQLEITMQVKGNKMIMKGVNLANNTSWTNTLIRMDKSQLAKTSFTK